MKKIHSNLEHEMKLNPSRVFNVLITLHKGEAPDSLALLNYNLLMDNIITTSLSSAQIITLSAKEQIVAIELDEEMKVF